MSRNPRSDNRLPEALFSLGLLLSFFLPWLRSMGRPVAGHEIRAWLAGPHRLISYFHPGTRLSADYRLSLLLWVIPVAAGLVLLAIGLRRYRAWMGMAAGAAAVAAFLFFKGEVAGFPFQRLAGGSYLACAAGAGLALAPLLRSLAR